MIVYEKFSSLCHDLGYSAKALYTASNSIFKHYHTVEIPKKNGGKALSLLVMLSNMLPRN